MIYGHFMHFKYNLISILSGTTSQPKFDIGTCSVQTDPRLAQAINKWKLTWNPTTLLGDREEGHIDGYSIDGNVITVVAAIRGEYRCCPRILSLAIAKQILHDTYSASYTVEAQVLCFETINVRKVTLNDLVIHEARSCLRGSNTEQ